jgi:hypothetical protein
VAKVLSGVSGPLFGRAHDQLGPLIKRAGWGPLFHATVVATAAGPAAGFSDCEACEFFRPATR